MPQRKPQEHVQEHDEACRERAFRRRAVDRVRLRLHVEELMEEAELDAEIGQCAPGHERGRRKNDLVVRSKEGREEDCHQACKAQHHTIEELPVRNLDFIIERLQR